MKPLHFAGVALLALVLGLTSYWISNQSVPLQTRVATVIDPARPLPQADLITQTSTSFTSADLNNKWSIMFFGFTYCPDICPSTLQSLKSVLAELKQNDIDDVQIVFVSVDPERDTPARLTDYLSHFGANFIGVTGEYAQISAYTKSMGVVFAHHPPDETGYYAVDHSAVLVLVDNQARMRAVFSAPHSVENIVNDIAAIRG